MALVLEQKQRELLEWAGVEGGKNKKGVCSPRADGARVRLWSPWGWGQEPENWGVVPLSVYSLVFLYSLVSGEGNDVTEQNESHMECPSRMGVREESNLCFSVIKAEYKSVTWLMLEKKRTP